jgi:hypothetical protein
MKDPATPAALQAKINDPNTTPENRGRYTALLKLTAVARQNAIDMDAQKARALADVSQGSPEVAGKLLYTRALLPDDMGRGRTPEFMAAAVSAANRYAQAHPELHAQYGDHFSVNEARGQAAQAASTMAWQFYGNADSMLTKGGTIDQTIDAARALGAKGSIPLFNSVANIEKAKISGSPELAAFSAKVLGLADDYAKVMGGAVGTDTARKEIQMNLDAAKTFEQKVAVLNAYRGSVNSQREGRWSNNPYMRDMFPRPPQSTDVTINVGGRNFSFPSQREAQAFQAALEAHKPKAPTGVPRSAREGQ